MVAARLFALIVLAALAAVAARQPSPAVTPLPDGWTVRQQGLCGGSIAPDGGRCSGVAAPGFSSAEAAWPFRHTGFSDAAFAADACKRSCEGCIAVTCGPAAAPAPGNVTAWCWARSQRTSFCTVPGYSSYSDFPSPPPPLPRFRLPSIFGDHMVLQRATPAAAAATRPLAAALWGHAMPRSTVSVAVRRAGQSGVVMASAQSVAGKNGRWRLILSYAPRAADALAPHTLVFASSADHNASITLNDGESIQISALDLATYLAQCGSIHTWHPWCTSAIWRGVAHYWAVQRSFHSGDPGQWLRSSGCQRHR
jgi:hypothetical protein